MLALAAAAAAVASLPAVCGVIPTGFLGVIGSSMKTGTGGIVGCVRLYVKQLPGCFTACLQVKLPRYHHPLP